MRHSPLEPDQASMADMGRLVLDHVVDRTGRPADRPATSPLTPRAEAELGSSFLASHRPGAATWRLCWPVSTRQPAARHYRERCVTRYDSVLATSFTAGGLVEPFGAKLAHTIREEAPMHRLWYDLRTNFATPSAFSTRRSKR